MLLNCGAGRLLRVPWTARRSNQSILKEINREYSFIGRTDAEGEAPILWPPDVKGWLIVKKKTKTVSGKDWRQEEKGTTEDKMVGWHHWLNGHGFGWTPGVGDGQEGLACCSPWCCRVGHNWESEQNWTELNGLMVFPTFFNLSLNLAIRSSRPEPQSARSLVFADSVELLNLWLQRI